MRILDPDYSIFHHRLLALASEWVACGEMYVHVRLPVGSYWPIHYLFTDFDSYLARLMRLPCRSDVSLFRNRQLPIRGELDENLIKRISADRPARDEWLVAELGFNAPLSAGVLWDDESERCEVLQKFARKVVAVGPYPEWGTRDHDDMQSGLVPMFDGSVEIGSY